MTIRVIAAQFWANLLKFHIYKVINMINVITYLVRIVTGHMHTTGEFLSGQHYEISKFFVKCMNCNLAFHSLRYAASSELANCAW